ncbi:two pore channel protein 2 isoform X1 [Pangasianodon hypophthalmus]|uniref:two pore channel protein 2 isoform X1 n=2 Tax=Pangasianodon hypophthalmus TaxID=310915 RepID=UPI00147DDE92|nr:two pore channel protein 2 isoform X1 [Pangasianodon hypophthalmus]XP_034164462.1 two pore channel protein 2 isoform X1 [Pangasianodon hypophthalmus]
METEPLLSESRKQDSVDYGSRHDSESDSQSDSKGTSRLSYSHSRDSVHVEERDEELCIQQAVVFIEDAIQYRSINHKVDLRSLSLYRWYYSRTCQWGLGITIAVILALAFVEKPSSITYTSDPRFRPDPWEPPCGLPEAVEMVCLCIFIVDVVVKSYLIGWEEFRMNKWLIGYVLVIAVSVIDCMISFAMLCGTTIRVRRLIRPFFLLQNSSLMKKTLKCIKRTLPEIASVILLLALHLCLFTMIGMLIFPKFEDSSKNGEWEAYFKDLPKALSSLLVLLTTANNPDVMVPAYSLNRGYTIFFILFSVCGTYILMNLLTAIIYNQFRGYLLMSVQASILRRHLGITAAFKVLCCPGQSHDDNSEGHVKRVRVDRVLQVMRRVQMTSYYRQAVIKAAQEFPDGFIDGEAFRRLFNELDKEHIREHPPKPEYSSSFLQSVQNVCSHYYFTVVGNTVALANVICICSILVLDSDKTVMERNDYYMEIINWAFIIYYLLEMILKLIALGWRGYISYRNNIFDGFFTVLLLILQVTIFVMFRITNPKSMPTLHGNISLWEMVRLVNMLIVFRFLRIIPEVKMIKAPYVVLDIHLYPLMLWNITKQLMALVASTLVDLVKNLRAFAGILVVVYYVYAVIGIWLFQGAITPPASSAANSTSENGTSNFTMECGSYEQLEYWPNNFDDFASSLVLLYDVMVVNNWQVFMDAYTRYTTEWSKVYFVSWWLTSSVMWVNLFVALILENFTYKWDKSHALSVSDVERTNYETTVLMMFRDQIQGPSQEDIESHLQCLPHLHLPHWSLQSHSP